MSEQKSGNRHTAGAFDIRTFIATLMGLFGVILLITGIVAHHETSKGTTVGGGINVWVGIALLIFAAVMQGWAMLRPTVVDEAQLAREREEDASKPPPH